MSETWHPALAETDLPADGKATALLGGWHVLIVRDDTGLHALNDRCTHQAALLSPGRVRRGAVMCPLHGARFEVASGRCLGGAYPDLRTFPVRSTDGMIEVAVPDAPPGPEERPVGV
ncbi:Rieske (2Fe-2S) protein [Novosphingobium piscinae]|uniref:Rieske (2Fe-2S) protein n=1 Tax=Novosphingobium piscinae TaxID=1507448 RepID=A0A7X1KQT0_9SPHN|nr:Rieske (2Fe-2S) protein [Novosphingobium piscinae]